LLEAEGVEVVVVLVQATKAVLVAELLAKMDILHMTASQVIVDVVVRKVPQVQILAVIALMLADSKLPY
jgi:hypothetical protein